MLLRSSYATLVLLALFLLASAAGAQRSFEDLARDARTGKSFERARAARALAELDRHEAWEVLLELLPEEAGEAAGSAQWYLGTSRDEDVVARLAGKEGLASKDESVRWRAAEALGRVPVAVDLAALWKVAAGDRSTDARRLAWRSLGLRAARGEDVLGEDKQRTKNVKALLKAVAKDKDDEVRARALVVSAALVPDEARAAIVEAARAKRPGLRAAAATSIAESRGLEELLVTLSADEHWAVRRAALEAWAARPDRSAMLALAGRLTDEANARLRARLVDLLRGWSKLRHGADARPWLAWAEALPEDWRPGGASSRAEPLEVSSSWNGVPILSTRVAFLIDLSGSIREQRGDGRTRKDVVDEELALALGSLDPETEFVLIGYHRDVLLWEDEPKPASPKNVASALAWFRGITSSGPGNLWAAIERAWSFADGIDTLFVLHDGAPTGGVLYRAELYRDLFLERNLTRQLFFDTVLVDSSRFVRGLFTELAERSGGLAVARTLDGKEEQ